jgi:hypothetical protein
MPAERRGAISGAPSFANSIISFPPNASASGATSAATNSTGAMSGFNFGPTPAPLLGSGPAPAPTGTFNFGAPAPGGGSASPFGAQASRSLFGNTGTTTAATPAGGSGLFGGTPAPAAGVGGLFGSPPAPSAAGLFGSAPAPTGAGGLFGSLAPQTGFGTTTAFGTPAPANNLGFGGALAPALGFGGTSAYGAQAPAAGMPSGVAGFTPYSALPPQQKQMIDSIHQAMMQHKRTVLVVQSMEPKLLAKPSAAVLQQADAAAGGSESPPLAVSVQQIGGQIRLLEQKLSDLNDRMMRSKHLYETTTTQAIIYAKWPIEAVAMRAGVTLTNNTANIAAANSPAAFDADQKKAEEVRQQLQNLLDRAAATVDRIERMPSPYLWQCIEDMEGRIQQLKAALQNLKQSVDVPASMSSESNDVVTIARLQEEAIWKVGAMLANVHTKVEHVRQLYRHCEKGVNVLELARREELHRQRQLDDKMRMQLITNLAPTAAPAPGPTLGVSLFGNASGTPTYGGGSSLFGNTPAPTAFSFGSNPAPAPALGSASFSLGGSSNAAPAPSFDGAAAFRSATPGPATSGFGAPPAPAFGAVPAPASFSAAAPPAFGASTTSTAPLFGATSSTPKAKNKSRSGTRRR